VRGRARREKGRVKGGKGEERRKKGDRSGRRARREKGRVKGGKGEERRKKGDRSGRRKEAHTQSKVRYVEQCIQCHRPQITQPQIKGVRGSPI
jgi:hypothetical protein